jgi:UPF0271 protein
VLVLDTSAFIAGFDPFGVTDPVFTAPAVGHEVVSNSIMYTRFRTAVESGKLQVKAPSTLFVDKVAESSKALGDVLYLSDTDKQVLALALELKNGGEDALIVTDDYSIQNVADKLGLGFAPLMTFGIRYRLDWMIYCPACHRKYPTDYKPKTCETCGTELKRKPLKKTLLRR